MCPAFSPLALATMDKPSAVVGFPGTAARWAHYLTPSAVHRRLGLVCLGIGGQAGALPTCGPRSLPCFAVVLVTRGAGWLSVGSGARREVVAPALFWLRPDQSHRYAPDPAWAETWVLFEGPAVDAYAELGYLDAIAPVADLRAVQRSFARLADACKPNAADREVAAAAGVHDLLVVLRRARADREPSTAPVLSALRRDAHLPMSVADHARRLGLPTPALREAVRRATGCGPKEFLVRARLDAAKWLLMESDLTVAAIGRRVGYDDPAYFTRIFARHVGVPPGRFRTIEAL